MFLFFFGAKKNMENLKEQLTRILYKNSFDGDSYHSYILFENMDKILEEQTIISKKYAELKCRELLEIVGNKIIEIQKDDSRKYVSKKSILNAVDLKEFIK